MEQRKQVINKCDEVISINKQIQDSNNHILVKKMSEYITNRANRIKEICSIDKYDIYFNGSVGIGKSTAICSLFGLIDEYPLDDHLKLSDIFLLKTGTGRTTICETEIIFNSESNCLLIEGVSKEDFTKKVKELVNSIQGSIKDENSNLAEEEKTLIKNMAGIPLNANHDEILLIFKNEKLEDEVLKKINYDNRTKLKLENDREPFKSWLKATFSDVNNGKITDVPMPKKVTIYISKKDTPEEFPNFVNSIFDTRGIDGGERPDIQLYITKNNSISIMCDEIRGIASNEALLSILKQTLIKEDKDNKQRVVLMGIDTDGDLDDITEFEDDREGGIKFKTNQAFEKMTNMGISFEKENILLLDTISGISVEKKKIKNIDKNKLKLNQENFASYLEEILNNMYHKYKLELLEDLQSLEKMRYSQIEDDTLNKISDIRQLAIEQKNKLEKMNYDILKKFENGIKNIQYVASLWGAVNHNGVGNKENVYGIFQKCGGEEFEEEFTECKTVLIAKIEQIFKYDSEIAKVCEKNIISKMNELYKSFYEEYRSSSYQETFENLCNNDSWRNPKKYWGDGLGNYNKRVWADISLEIKNKGIDEKLNKQALELNFLNEFISFLEV